MSPKAKKLLILYLPYIILGLIATKLGQAWRLAAGADIGPYGEMEAGCAGPDPAGMAGIDGNGAGLPQRRTGGVGPCPDPCCQPQQSGTP